MKTLLKIYLLFLFTISIYTNADAQKPVTWQKIFGLDSNVQGTHGVQTADGGYVILAQWSPLSAYPNWTRVLKLDKSGNLIWSRNFNVETYNGVTEDNDFNYLLIGYGGNGAALFKISNNGDSLLYKTYGGSSVSVFRSIKKYYDGGFVLTGSGSNGTDIFGYMTRINSNYNIIWENTFRDSNFKDVYFGGLNIDQNHNIVISIIGGGFGVSYLDGGIIKLNPNGNIYLKKWDFTDSIFDSYGEIINVNGKYSMFGGARSIIPDSLKNMYCILDTNGNLLYRKYYYDSLETSFKIFRNAGANNFVLGGHHINTITDIKMGIRKIDYFGNIIWTRIIKNALTVSAPWSMLSTSDNGFLLIGNYENVPADVYCIYVIKTDSNAYAEPLGISDEEFMIPEEFVLYQNYPNPFNPDTKIKYEIRKKAHYKMRLYDVNGRLISVLIDETVSPGIYEKNLNTYFKDLSSSVYFISLENNAQVLTRKLLFIK